MHTLVALNSTEVNPMRAMIGRLRMGSEARPYRDLYDVLDAYYHNNGLYDALRAQMHENALWTPGLKSIRNPCNAVVEFYAATVAPGALERALPIRAENEEITPRIVDVWQWSNLGARKNVAIRRMATYGDEFIKIATRRNRRDEVERVYLELLPARYVTAFDVDERDFLTFVRIDIPQAEDQGHQIRRWMFTEVWDKESGTYREWHHDRSQETPLDELGTPAVDEPIERLTGVDFIPIVRLPQKDIGLERGQGAFVHALDGIDELNLQATRLHQMLFRHNNVTHVLRANGTTANNESLPAPRLVHQRADENDDPNIVTIGDDRFYRLPGTSELQQLVPALNYDAALNVVQAQMRSLESWDLPELMYYRIPDLGDLSGRAIRYMLTAAIDRVLEVRGNFENGLARADMMALSVAQVNNLPGFSVREIGTFHGGDFQHTFAEREIIPLNDLEEAQADEARVRALETKYTDLHVPRRQVWHEAGYSDEKIVEMEAWLRAEQGEQAELFAQRFDGGRVPLNPSEVD